jgi:nucleoside-diphosphate-sugar epimerase
MNRLLPGLQWNLTGEKELTMNVFVTGASGHIGTVVTAELLRAGHKVIGLARSDEAEQRLVQVGAK